MTQRFSAQAWLAWTVATAGVVLVTRNPLYLGVILLSVLAVYVSLEHRSAIALAWSTVLRIGLVIAGISVIFNVLTVHSGDRQFGALPDSWPIIGGPLTWNAALYGAISGMALLGLLLIAATLSTAVDRAALVRLVPQSLSTIGVAAAAALSMFPETIRAITRVREAHRARGLKIRSLGDTQYLIVPVLNIGLERAFHLAESMESRAFGNRVVSARFPTGVAVGLLASAMGGVVLLSLGYQMIAGGVFLVTCLAFVVVASRSRQIEISHYRESRIARTDLPLLLSTGVMLTLTLIEVVDGSGTLNYSTYPSIAFPHMSMLFALTCALSVLPAVLPGKQREMNTSHA